MKSKTVWGKPTKEGIYRIKIEDNARARQARLFRAGGIWYAEMIGEPGLPTYALGDRLVAGPLK